MSSCGNYQRSLSFSAGVLAFLALSVGLVSSAQELYLSQTSQDPVSMAAAHSSPLSATKPPPLDWHQEGSSSGEWSSKGGTQSSNIILPTAALHPLTLLRTTQTSSLANDESPFHDTNTITTYTVSTESHVKQSLELGSGIVNQGPMHNLVRVPQIHNPVPVSPNQASSSNSSSPESLSTEVPNIDVESTARGAPNSLALMSTSGSDRGDTLTAHHVEPQKLSVEEPTDPSREYVPDLDRSSLASLSFSSVDANPALGLKLRENARGAAHHAITLREVHAVNEPPTKELEVEPTVGPFTPVKNLTSTAPNPSPSTEPSLKTENPTNIPSNHTAPSKTTTDEGHGQAFQGNGTDNTPLGHWLGNVTAYGGLLSDGSSVEEVPAQGNSSEPPSTQNGSYLNRQVPATTQDPWMAGNSSGPTVDSPPPRMMICLSRMDIVWIVLAISVPVSSCCK